MLRVALKNPYLIGSVVLLLIVVCAETVAQARISKYIASVAVSEKLLFIGEFGGRILIFNMKKKAVVAKPSIYMKDGRVQNMRLINDNGRILAIAFWDYALNRAFFEITPEGDVEKIGVISGRFNGFDRDNFYCSRSVREGSASRYEAFRLDKEFQNPQEGHIPGHSNLLIYAQTEDALNYYFFCSLTADTERKKKGFALVSKNKVTGKIDVFRFTEDVNWMTAKMTNDQESVWLLLYSKNNSLIHYSKQDKILSVTPYLSGNILIRNLNGTELPPWTYVGHQSYQVFPMSKDAVQRGELVYAKILFLRYGEQDIYSEINGFWTPDEEFNYGNRSTIIPSNIQHVFSKYTHYSRSSFTYGENLWLVAFSRDDDGSIYHIIKVPMVAGDPKVIKIQPTSGEKVTHGMKRIKDFFEAMGMIIFGH